MKARIIFFLLLFTTVFAADSTKVDTNQLQMDSVRKKFSQQTMLNFFLKETGKSIEDAFTDLLIEKQSLSMDINRLQKRLEQQRIQLIDSLLADLKSLESAKVDSILKIYTE